ncbi:MAG: DUF2061 domain-containing protein [Caldisericum exile]|uniref:DUF2061 domain-containing protein n=1 Tax=Caldisericum exile TaxID=693075 RepID=UPI003C792BE1
MLILRFLYKQLRKRKTIIKTILYRILGISSSILIGYVLFRTWEGATLATVLIEATRTLIYYLFERLFD